MVVANRAEPLANEVLGRADAEQTPLPAFLQKRLETGQGPGIAQFHAEMSREPRDPVWAAATEYQIQAALQELAPDIIGRMHLYQTTCASTMCEMVAVLDDLDPAQASKDIEDWQTRIHQASGLDNWKATGLGPSVALELSVDPEGHRPVFIIQFRKDVSSRDKSLANRARLTRG